MAMATNNANSVVGYLFGNATYTLPATYYVGLSTTTPTITGTNITEPVGLGYARVAITNDSTNWNTASSRAVTNKTAIDFVESTGDWGTITHIVIFDALTGGNALYYDSVSARQVYNATTVSFPADSVTISIPSA